MPISLLPEIFNEKTMPSIIGTAGTLLVFVLGLFTKGYFDNRSLSVKLKKEHDFEQQKRIKDVLAKYKIHLVTACEDMNHRLWNFANKYDEPWLNMNQDYFTYRYYFHSFIYRLIAVFAWAKKIETEMIFLDTTIASKEDLELIKFLNLFPRLFCDLTFLEGLTADGNHTTDHFYRDDFNLLPEKFIKADGVVSFLVFQENLREYMPALNQLSTYIENLNPLEQRKRWDRLHFFHVTLIAFLNNYGYDFQQTDKEKMKKILTKPKKTAYWPNYFKLINEYKLQDNAKIKEIKTIIEQL